MLKMLACLIVSAAFIVPASASIRVEVDKSEQRMYVYEDGNLTNSWKVSTGLPSQTIRRKKKVVKTKDYETPIGEYKVEWMAQKWRSKEFNEAEMPHSMFFSTRGHAIHGTDAEKRLGRKASHGCVRLSRENAKKLYGMVRARGGQAQIAIVE